MREAMDVVRDRYVRDSGDDAAGQDASRHCLAGLRSAFSIWTPRSTRFSRHRAASSGATKSAPSFVVAYGGPVNGDCALIDDLPGGGASIFSGPRRRDRAVASPCETGPLSGSISCEVVCAHLRGPGGCSSRPPDLSPLSASRRLERQRRHHPQRTSVRRLLEAAYRLTLVSILQQHPRRH